MPSAASSPSSSPSPSRAGDKISRRATAPLRAAILLSALVFLSRFIGLFQASFITAVMPSDATDAYKYAFALPDFLNYLMAGGAISLTFIPLFTTLWTRGKEAAAWRFFSTLASLMGAGLLVLTVLMMILARDIILWSKPGLAQPDKIDTLNLAVSMTRIMLPAQLFFYLGALMVGILNAFKRFGASGWTGAVYNLAALLVALPLWFLTKNPLVFAWGILGGAFVGNFVLPFLALKTGPRAQRPRFRVRFDLQNPAARRFFKLALPIMLGASFPVVDVWVVQFFTSGMPDGAFTHIDNANRLLIAAQGLLGQAAAVAAFPFLASKIAEKDFLSFSEFLRTGLRRLIFITLPLSVLMILLAQPLVGLIFGWGKYNDAQKIGETAVCFAYFAVGLFAWGAQALVARGFYALGDTKTPTIYGTTITLIYFGVCALFMRIGLGLAGLAFATSLGAAAQFLGLLLLLENKMRGHRYNAPLNLDKVSGTLLRTLTACGLMGMAGLMALLLAQPLHGDGRMGDAFLLVWVGGVATFVFVAAAAQFEIPEWKWMRAKFTRRRH